MGLLFGGWGNLSGSGGALKDTRFICGEGKDEKQTCDMNGVCRHVSRRMKPLCLCGSFKACLKWERQQSVFVVFFLYGSSSRLRVNGLRSGPVTLM